MNKLSFQIVFFFVYYLPTLFLALDFKRGCMYLTGQKKKQPVKREHVWKLHLRCRRSRGVWKTGNKMTKTRFMFSRHDAKQRTKYLRWPTSRSPLTSPGLHQSGELIITHIFRLFTYLPLCFVHHIVLLFLLLFLLLLLALHTSKKVTDFFEE